MSKVSYSSNSQESNSQGSKYSDVSPPSYESCVRSNNDQTMIIKMSQFDINLLIIESKILDQSLNFKIKKITYNNKRFYFSIPEFKIIDYTLYVDTDLNKSLMSLYIPVNDSLYLTELYNFYMSIDKWVLDNKDIILKGIPDKDYYEYDPLIKTSKNIGEIFFRFKFNKLDNKNLTLFNKIENNEITETLEINNRNEFNNFIPKGSTIRLIVTIGNILFNTKHRCFSLITVIKRLDRTSLPNFTINDKAIEDKLINNYQF